MRVNVYNNSLPGHANVSFYENGEHQYTVGANILHETPKLAFPQTLPFLPDDGIYRDESAYHLAELVAETVTWASVPLPEVTYDRLLSEARALENQTYNYSLLTEACVDLVAEFYAQTGHPGEFGDLFATEDRHGSLVWMRVPTTASAQLETQPATEPFYVPSDVVYVDKLAMVEFSDFGLTPTNGDYPLFEQEWVGLEDADFGTPVLDTSDVKAFDVAPSPKGSEIDATPAILNRTGSKLDKEETDNDQQNSSLQTEAKDDPFEYFMKEDHFEFAPFDSYDPKPDPSEEWDLPSPVEHKSPPTTTEVDFSKPEPEQFYVDPDYYGYF
ncbi:hypothetical protein [Gymnodinialimonas hymeniacidonis]|uniref:hypothetical protein n=1 Tax=Gymnodinialimonas hymeniacidonis TaxID=3126508 RepID=UPI0034C6A924